MDQLKDPLALEGWQQFNCEKWGLHPASLRVSTNGSNLPAVEVKCFLNEKGHLFTPPLTPYVPVFFYPTPTKSSHRIERQWLEVSELLVQRMLRFGLSNYLLLPPRISDVRAWQWGGYRVRVRYTFFLDLPYDNRDLDQTIRNRYRRASKEGYTCSRTDKMADVLHCLEGTAERQGLECRLSKRDLELARNLLGSESFRTYVCYSLDGTPVSTQVALFNAGSYALDWLAGTVSTHLNRGVVQLLTKYMLDDLQAVGATGIDLVGANIPGVSIAKANWGARLIPFYRIESQGLKQVVSALREWWRFYQAPKRPLVDTSGSLSKYSGTVAQTEDAVAEPITKSHR